MQPPTVNNPGYVCQERQPIPAARLDSDEDYLGFPAFDAINRLLEGTPPVAVNEGAAQEGAWVINPRSLRDEDVAALIQRLREILGYPLH